MRGLLIKILRVLHCLWSPPMSPGIRVFLVSGAFVLLACHGPEARAESGVKVASPSNGANLTGATTTSVSANIAMPDGKTASAIRVRVYASMNGYIELFSSTFPPLPAGQTAFNANIGLPTFNMVRETRGYGDGGGRRHGCRGDFRHAKQQGRESLGESGAPGHG